MSPSLQVDAKSLLVCCITAGLWYIQQVDAVATARFGGALFFVFDVGAIVSACRFKIGAFSDVCSREDGAVNTLLLPVLLCCFPLRDLNQVHIYTRCIHLSTIVRFGPLPKSSVLVKCLLRVIPFAIRKTNYCGLAVVSKTIHVDGTLLSRFRLRHLHKRSYELDAKWRV